MSTLLLAVVFGVVPPGEGTPSMAVWPSAALDQQPVVPYRTGPELREAVHDTLRRWARPRDKEADLAAREFLALYGELQHDNKLARTQREQLRTKVRGRLLRLAEQIEKRVAIQKRLAKAKGPASVDGGGGQEHILAQWGGFGGRGGFGGGMMGGPMPGGGMMMGGAFGGGRFGGTDDYGEQLVELIQQTIAPNTWDVNGGPGSIYYWRPGRAIVVRQMGDVHDQIADVLQQMGRMGR